MTRAISPVLGATLLISLTVFLATAMGAMSAGIVPGVAPTGPVVVDGTADAATGRITLLHEAGPAIDVDGLRIRVTIDDTPLAAQPPVPFFSAAGFRSGPTGPFNSASDPAWTAGEAASFVIAGTNAPTLTPGATVELRLVQDGTVLTTVTMRAE